MIMEEYSTELKEICEQPDFSTDMADNGRINVAVLSLTDSSDSLAKRILDHIRGLPTFQPQGQNQEGLMSVRAVRSLPYWAKEEKGRSERVVKRHKNIYALIGVACCDTIDELTDIKSGFDGKVGRLSNPSLVSRCIILGKERKDYASTLKKCNDCILIGEDDLTGGVWLPNMMVQLMTEVYSVLVGEARMESGVKKMGTLPRNTGYSDEEKDRCQRGQTIKARADVQLLMGQWTIASKLYRGVLATLPSKEHLWLGATLEGLLCAQLHMQYQHTTTPLSLTTPTDQMPSNMDAVDGINEALVERHVFTSDDKDHESSTELDNSFTDGGNEFLSKNKIDKQFQQIMSQYTKAGQMGRKPLAELYIKYVGHLLSHEKCHHREVDRYLQDTLSLLHGESHASYSLSLYLVLTQFYHQLQLKRKSLFMMFRAALQATEKCKTQAYPLLSKCLSLFNSIHESDGDSYKGWLAIKTIILARYVFLCWELDYYKTVIKSGWLLLQNFYEKLSPEELRRLVEYIHKAAKHLQCCSGNSVVGVPAPSPLTMVPYVSTFKPRPMEPDLVAKHSVTLFASSLKQDNNQGPFLYSMLGKKKDHGILWVQGDPAEVILDVSNPIVCELKLEKMRLVLEGAKTVCYPSNIALPPSCSPQQFVLLCIPHEPGPATLKGFTTTILGLDIESEIAHDIPITVLPSLPQLRVKIFPHPSMSATNSDDSVPPSESLLLIKRRSFSTLDTFELLDGEHCTCDFQLQSIGDVPVDNLKISTKELTSDYFTLTWSKDTVQSLLPLDVKKKIYTFPLGVSVGIPSYLKIGSPKTHHLHSPRVLLHVGGVLVPPRAKKSKTLGPSNRHMTDTDTQIKPKPHGSPSRLQRMGGSFRTPQPYQSKPHSVVKTGLLESLDLSTVPSAPINIINSSPQPQKKLFISDSPDSAHLHQSQKDVAASPKSYLRKSIKKLGFKQPMNSPKHDRFMDSLNLEHSPNSISDGTKQLSIDVNPPFTRNSDGIEFDAISNDRISIKSDPGDTEGLPFSIPTSPPPNSPSSFSLKSATVGSREGERKRVYSKDTRKTKLAATMSLQYAKPQVAKEPSLPKISSPSEARKIKRAPPKTKRTRAVFLLQYTGGLGASQGYYREVTMEINVVIKPSLTFDEFGITAVKGYANLFSFEFEITNVSPYSLEVALQIEQEGLSRPREELVLHADTSQVVALCMRRFTLPDCDTSVATLKESGIIKLYCQHIIKLIKISWKNTAILKTGSVTLEGLVLPQSALTIIRPIPLLFEIHPDPEPHRPGLPIVVNMKVTNNTGSKLPSSMITLSPFLLTRNGEKVDCLKHNLLIFSQSLNQRLPELDADATHNFILTLFFLQANEYFIDVHHLMPIRNGSVPLDTKTESPATSNSKTNEEAAPSLEPASVPSSQPPAEGSSHDSPPPSLITSPVMPLMGPSGNRGVVHPVKLEHCVISSSVRQLMSHCITYVGPQLNFKITA